VEEMNSNPFTVSSPEMMDAAEMRRLYVPLAENFEIEDQGHVFVHGHRGCGKSMMLRLLAPDCKALELGCKIADLPYLGLYASIKSTDLDIAEFERIKNQFAGTVLAEHSLCLFLASKVLQSLREHTGVELDNDAVRQELRPFLNKMVLSRLAGLDANTSASAEATPNGDPLLEAIEAIDARYSEFMDYMRQLSLTEEYVPFRGRVVGYREFLFPLCANLTSLSFLPRGKPVYVLLDDSDNLNAIQTQVLNTWVSYRTGAKVSLKISTQLGYKHYRTSANQRIESPHDFKEVDISTIYTGGLAKGKFPAWVEAIVTKRLAENGINVPAKDFFPVAKVQEEAIEKLKEELKAKWALEGRGFSPGDDATRYARPDYIKSLGGTSKQGSSYLYAGFDQLVHISSGIIRFFLDDAASMYAEELKISHAKSDGVSPLKIQSIRPAIQDQVVRDSADALMIDNLDKLVDEADDVFSELGSKDDFKQLRNLIQALGGVFQKILMSDRSERRVLSIALSDTPPDEVMRILKLGVRHGFLYEAMIGSKDGRSRTRRYVLTRRLAPMFKLDPTGFAGYLFVQSAFLQSALVNPARTVREFEQSRLGTIIDDSQTTLEFE
jgi:hypothetical protein